MNLTSMNGERRLRLSEKFMDPPGSAKPDCLIAARHRQHNEGHVQRDGKADMAKRFDGFEWKTEEDAFNDGFRRAGQPGVGRSIARAATPGNLATYERLREAGNNGVQLPIKEVQGRQARRHRDALHGRQVRHQGRQGRVQAVAVAGTAEAGGGPEGEAQVLDQQRPVNEIWQTAYHDQYNELRARPLADGLPRDEPRGRAAAGLAPGDMVEVYNDYGSTYAMAYPKSIASVADLHAVRLLQRRGG